FYFVFSPLIFALLLLLLKPIENYKNVVFFLFWAIAAAFIAEKAPFFLEELKNPSLLLNAFLTSELPTESNYAFEFGMFVIVFIESGNIRYTIISFFLLF